MRTVMMGYHNNGSMAALLDQNNGFIEVVCEQKGQPRRVVGVYPKERLLAALNRYHQVRDAIELVSSGGRLRAA